MEPKLKKINLLNDNWTLFCQRSRNNSKILDGLFSRDVEINKKKLGEFITITLSSQETFIQSCLRPELKDINKLVKYLRLIEKENKIINKYIHKAGDYKHMKIESPIIKCMKIFQTIIESLEEKLDVKNQETIKNDLQKTSHLAKCNEPLKERSTQDHIQMKDKLNSGAFKSQTQKTAGRFISVFQRAGA